MSRKRYSLVIPCEVKRSKTNKTLFFFWFAPCAFKILDFNAVLQSQTTKT